MQKVFILFLLFSTLLSQAQTADFYYSRGNDKFNLEDYYGAIADYTKAIELDPNYVEAYNNRGFAKFKLKGSKGASSTVGGTGVPSQPNIFYIGVNNGGIWKTDDFGRTWNPIFDEAPTGSIGDIAVSESQPDVIYVGMDEGELSNPKLNYNIHLSRYENPHRPDLGVEDGMFKSIDGGKSWIHIGIFQSWGGMSDLSEPDYRPKFDMRVGRVVVHPTKPELVFVAGLGHPHRADVRRGVWKTTDGGKNWRKVLHVDDLSDPIQLEFDPNNPEILFAYMWQHKKWPWENAIWSGPNSGLYKSTDGGEHWREIENGLPGADQGLGRIGFTIAPSNSNLMFALVDAREEDGLYKSTDGGESWVFLYDNQRLWGRGGDFAEIKVHPKDPDRLYVGNVASYTSANGGKTWSSLKGAPGGDDYHRIWINPNFPDIMLFVADQDAMITVNAGRTWSSWYNQPTAIADYTKAIELDPNSSIAYNNRGLAKDDLEDYNEAIADYTKAIEIGPNNTEAYKNRGITKENVGNLSGACSDWRKAADLGDEGVAEWVNDQCNNSKHIGPNDAETYFWNGNNKHSQKDYNGAIVDYSKAIEIDPNYTDSYINRGSAKLSLEDYYGAMAEMSKIIKFDPNYLEAYRNRGIAKEYLEDYNGAIADYTKAIEIDPNYVEAYNNRGLAKRYMEDYYGAIADYTKAIELDPNYVDAYGNRGDAKKNVGDISGACADWRKKVDLGGYTNKGVKWIRKRCKNVK